MSNSSLDGSGTAQSTPSLNSVTIPSQTATESPLLPIIREPTPDISTLLGSSSTGVRPAPFDPSLVAPLLEATIRQLRESSVWEGGAYDSLGSQDALAFLRTMQHEIDRLYPDGLPSAEELLLVQPGYTESETFRDLLTDAVVAYVDLQGIELKSGISIEAAEFDAEVYAIELDQDAAHEWLLVAYVQEIDPLWIVLDESAEGTYLRLEAEIPAFNHLYGSQQLFHLGDLTGDDLTDLIIVLDIPYAVGDQWLWILVAEGGPQGFSIISDLDHSVSSPKNEVSYELYQDDPSSLPTMKIHILNNGVWGCALETMFIYSWAGGREVGTSIAQDEQESLLCLLEQGMRASDPDEASRFFQRAIELPVEDSVETNEEQAFAYFQLAILGSLGYGDLDENIAISGIVSLAESSNSEFVTLLAEKLRPLLSQSQVFAPQICSATVELYQGSYGAARGWPAFFVYEGQLEGYPKPLCDLGSFLRLTLQHIPYLGAQSPRSLLLQQGFNVPVVLSFPSTGIASPVWLALIENEFERGSESDSNESRDYALAIQSEDHGWQVAGWIHNVNSSLITNMTDLTGDGIPEVAVAARIDMSWLCQDEGEIPYTVFVISSVADGWVIYVEDDICIPGNEAFRWGSVLLDLDGDGLSDWVIEHAANPSTGYGLSQDELGLDLLDGLEPFESIAQGTRTLSEFASRTAYLGQLDDLFFELEAYDDFQDLVDMVLESWDLSPIHTSQVSGHLMYLSSIASELQGDQVAAIDTLAQICALEPASLWTYLACARISE